MGLKTFFDSNNWALRLEIEHQIATRKTTFRWLIVNRDQDNYEEQIRGKSKIEFVNAAYSYTPDEIDAMLKQLVADAWDVATNCLLTSDGLLLTLLFFEICEKIVEHAGHLNNKNNSFPYIVDCGGMKAALRGAAAHYVDRWIAANGK